MMSIDETMGIDELAVESLRQAYVDLNGLEPGTADHKTQCEVVKMLNDIVREREKAADEDDEKNSKSAKRERRIERWLKYGLPAGVSLFEVLAIMLFESQGNFVTTKAFGLVQKVKDLFK